VRGATGHNVIQFIGWVEVTMSIRLLAAFAATIFAALLAGCAEAPYYGGTYGGTYSYGYSDYYGPGYYYGPDYYAYGPSYYYGPGIGFSYSYRGGDSGRHWDGDQHWNGSNWSSRSFQQGSVQTQPRTASRTTTQPRVRSNNANLAHAGRHVETQPRAARQPTHIASRTRTGPDREHGGG
jgi:hypothetical protein